MGDRALQIPRGSKRAPPEGFGSEATEDEGEEEEPPLVRFIRGVPAGGADAVRLKLYLSLLWCSSRNSHTGLLDGAISYPARFWARLLDLEDPSGRGKRRVSEALRWLGRSGLVTLDRRNGAPTAVRLPPQSGLGERGGDLFGDGICGKTAGGYIDLPASFWRNGWLPSLSGPAIVVLLILLDVLPNGDGETPLMPDIMGRYGLSQDTVRRGKAELIRLGLASVRRGWLSPDPFHTSSRRNLYRLHLDRLGAFPRFGVTGPELS